MFKYGDMVRDIANRERVSMEIDLDELSDFDEELADAVRSNVIRYQRLIASALDELIPKYRSVEHPPAKDILDTYIEHRRLNEERNHQDPNEIRNSFITSFRFCHFLLSWNPWLNSIIYETIAKAIKRTFSSPVDASI